ncbi:hypothetical protein ALP26_200081 [Pseudomonas savastanoi pv. glycinea]|uniref:Uncharacterized protein n=1 Tax=Pseudomonas savastanoi pv. glycinea TaxID=318 RepID=A0A3M5VNX7_PSESG|nr:hypothetical protein ALQ79_200713 [Pseudomonas amygdali pv. lachrymans]RMM67934.1 hypothetical protein ALQ75_200106 [Pseudomonas savastanoi pv. glycinea]RMR67516.1 hypothetical protein ALP82_200151 [Pseudomonas savastanoi pv. fraxini]RMU28064.1 hypothetical protein ALP31_200144 [Pseudomonas amygdali pv. morsprunorum]RMN28429.1 hypothetical protein ALQ66_200083 [Pseudomonas savastanoi pv. glycinea]
MHMLFECLGIGVLLLSHDSDGVIPTLCPRAENLKTRQVSKLREEAKNVGAFDFAFGPVIHGQGHHIHLPLSDPVHIQNGAVSGIDTQILAGPLLVNFIPFIRGKIGWVAQGCCDAFQRPFAAAYSVSEYSNRQEYCCPNEGSP